MNQLYYGLFGQGVLHWNFQMFKVKVLFWNKKKKQLMMLIMHCTDFDAFVRILINLL